MSKQATIRFAAIGLNHFHIYGQTNLLLRAGAELVKFYAVEPDLVERYAKDYPQATLARSEAEILEDESIQLVISAAIPNERAPLGIRVMQHGKDYMSDKPGFTTLEQLADGAMLFCGEFKGAPADLAEQHLTAPAREALADFAQRARDADWTREALSALIKAVLADRGLKMPQLAIPLRVAVTGQTQTPAVDAVLALLGKETVLKRLAAI